MTNNRGNQAVVDARARRGGVVRAFDWWCVGLAAALTSIANAIRPPRRFQLRTLSAPFVLHAVNGRAARTEVSLHDDPQRAIPAAILQKTRGSIIEVIVPAAAILERSLDPLPGESRPYVESVVQHQIEAIFPWRAADTLRTVQIRDRDDGRLDVSVRATARPAIAHVLELGAACSAREVVVSADGDRARNAASISVPLGAARVGAIGVARYAVAGLIALAVVVGGWTTFTQWSLSSDLAALDQTIAERRTTLKRAADRRDPTGEAGLEAKKHQAMTAVLIIETLSSILPDDTHLTELTLDAGRLRISGISSRATEIVPLLEGSGRLKNASFYAPTTRIAGGTADRFSIEAVVVPQAR